VLVGSESGVVDTPATLNGVAIPDVAADVSNVGSIVEEVNVDAGNGGALGSDRGVDSTSD
jgi:hypothetical protein